ncbi:hypothetical protein [Dyadobacter sp. CY323]|uniref:hypothetical protein n=1 Tax=Dyadobacter sp. CY323 TaxID=2907302 RepID=UPI001F2DBC96|nr:hypothetical protein [Dyadobacter sp. CY323]MCE6990116.1 hypothetical protein [Dyadobacter sp. CY323]
MTEVFKTNVVKENQARIMIDLIQRTFTGYSATFDLEDCDKVLCVKSTTNAVCATSLIRLMQDFGYQAEVLKDDVPACRLFSMHYSSTVYKQKSPATRAYKPQRHL